MPSEKLIAIWRRKGRSEQWIADKIAELNPTPNIVNREVAPEQPKAVKRVANSSSKVYSVRLTLDNERYLQDCKNRSQVINLALQYYRNQNGN